MHYLMSHQMFTRQLELMLTDAGLKSPNLVREGGPFTDTSSDLTPDQPANSHSHQTPGDAINASLSRSKGDSSFAVLKTMPKAVAYNRKVPWLRVNADAIVHLTMNARNSRDLINLPGGRVIVSFRVSNALELGLAPEIALTHGLVHPHGLTIPSGVFVAAHGALANHGVPNDTVDTLRDAYNRPAADGQFLVHVRLDSNGRFIVGDRALTPPHAPLKLWFRADPVAVGIGAGGVVGGALVQVGVCRSDSGSGSWRASCVLDSRGPPHIQMTLQMKLHALRRG